MTLASAIVITIVSILLSALFSGAEIAFVQSNKVRMEIDATSGGLVNRIIHGFTRHEDMFISSLLVGNNVVLVVYGIAFSIIFAIVMSHAHLHEAVYLVTNTLVSTAIILIMAEFLPKTIFRINPNWMLRAVALPLYLIYLILYPITLFVSWISRTLMRLFGIEGEARVNSALTMEELDDYIQQSLDEQTDEAAVDNEVKIFRNAIDFKDTQIHECMIPRNEIVAVNIEGTTRDQLIDLFTATGLSKIVVYRVDIDDVMGYIHISEMFEPDSDWTKRLKPVIFTPETMLADKMMRRMLSEKRSLAIVVDEFGGTAGLATLEDLVEEIFGEIEDEHDRNRLLCRRLPDGAYECSGRVEIEAINEKFHLDLRESEQYNTLAGYILEHLGALPQQGEVIDIEGLRFTIVRMSATRIEMVKITSKDSKEESKG